MFSSRILSYKSLGLYFDSIFVHGIRECSNFIILHTVVQISHKLMNPRTAAYSSVLAWRIPGTGEPGGLPSMGSHRVGHY